MTSNKHDVPGAQVSKDESRRLRERIDAAEKSAKSREKIEDSFRRKAEVLDKKCKVCVCV
jgi:hypothetical protein